MQVETILRFCDTCDKVLPFNEARTGQIGYLCCDLYYCDETCLNASFKDSGTTWDEHYDDDGDCYWTEWYLEDERVES